AGETPLPPGTSPSPCRAPRGSAGWRGASRARRRRGSRAWSAGTCPLRGFPLRRGRDRWSRLRFPSFVLEQAGDAVPPLDRVVVFEGQRRCPLHSHAVRDLRLENPMARAQARERVLALLLGAEHADVDAGGAEVRSGVNVGHGHESDTWVLKLSSYRVGEDLSDRLVDAPHPGRPHRPATITAERKGSSGSPCYQDTTQLRMSRRLRRSRSNEHPSGTRLSTKRQRPSARSDTSVSPTSAQSSVDRCHLSWPSVSATDAPKRRRIESFRDLTSFLLPFRS